jgi:hypothetical protein
MLNYIAVDCKPLYVPFDYSFAPAKEYIPPTLVYREIVFLQGSEADESIEILNDKGKEAAIQHLANYDYGKGEIMKSTPCGTADRIFQAGQYVMAVNFGIPYVSLCAMENQE